VSGSVKPKKERIDVLLVEQGFAESTVKAAALVMSGAVYIGERRVDKPGDRIAGDAVIDVREGQKYVSRGGVKLEGALRAHAVDPNGKCCVDVGSSTGGFTDCLLQHGARRVVAVDVGKGLLAHKLRQDARVVVREETNARHLDATMVDGAADLVVVDASFIGLETLTPALARITRPGGELLALIKPQFEVAERDAARARGVIRDPAMREGAISRVVDGVATSGFTVTSVSDCVLPGPKGNVEAFVYARRTRDAGEETE